MAIEVFRMIDDGSLTTGWYAKGNHTLEELLEGIEYENGREYWMDAEENKENLKVFHTHFRKVPISKYDDLPFSHWLIDSKPGRGAFEVSVIYFL